MTNDRKLLRGSTGIAPNMSDWLNILRAPAALIVLFSHAYSLYFGPSSTESTGAILSLTYKLCGLVAQWSHGAVMLFFVMSGYLVGGPHLIRALQGAFDGSRYSVDRLTRMYVVIVPALILTVALDWWVMRSLNGGAFIAAREGFFHGRTDFLDYTSPAQFACNAAFMQMVWCKQYGSNAALWSLSNEGLYYAMWGGLMLSFSRRWAIAIPIALLAIICSSPLVIGADARVGAYLVYLGIWVAGALTYALNPFRYTWLLLAIGTGAWLSLHNHLPQLASDALLALAVCSGLKWLEVSDLQPLSRSKAIKFAADTSFSLYATHLPVAIAAIAFIGLAPSATRTWHDLLTLGVIVLLCVGASLAFWACTEMHTKWIAMKLNDREWLRRMPMERQNSAVLDLTERAK